MRDGQAWGKNKNTYLHVHQSNTFARSLKALEACGCKPWVPNLLIILHTLGTPTTNIAHCIKLPCIVLEYIFNTETDKLCNLVTYQIWRLMLSFLSVVHSATRSPFFLRDITANPPGGRGRKEGNKFRIKNRNIKLLECVQHQCNVMYVYWQLPYFQKFFE